MLGISQLLQREGLHFFSSHWKLQKGDSTEPKQESQKKAKEFSSTALSTCISSQRLGNSRHGKDLVLTHDHSLRKTVCSSMGTGPQKGKFSHPGTQKALTSEGSEPRQVVVTLAYREVVPRPGQRKLGSASASVTIKGGASRRPA